MPDAHEELTLAAPQILQLGRHVVERHSDLRQLVAAGRRRPRIEITFCVRASDCREARQPSAEITAQRQGKGDRYRRPDDEREQQRAGEHPADHKGVEAPDRDQHPDRCVLVRPRHRNGANRGEHAPAIHSDGDDVAVDVAHRQQRKQYGILDEIDEPAPIRHQGSLEEVVAPDETHLFQHPLRPGDGRAPDGGPDALQLLPHEERGHLGLAKQLFLGGLARLPPDGRRSEEARDESDAGDPQTIRRRRLTFRAGSRHPTPSRWECPAASS